MEPPQFRCSCGRTFPSGPGLEQHQTKAKCRQFFSQRQREQKVVAAHSAQEEAPLKAEREAQATAQKRCRESAATDERTHRVALLLADLRYLKLIPGTHVDQMKSMHAKLNKQACEDMMADLRGELGSQVSDEALAIIKKVADRRFDIYDGLRTVFQERKVLNSLLQRPAFVPRQMPNGGTAYDFKIDEQLLLLLSKSSTARDQFYETLSSWRTEHQYTRDDPARIIADFMDADVLRDHGIFGDQARMPAAEAEEAAKEGPMRVAIVIWADGYVVSPGRLN